MKSACHILNKVYNIIDSISNELNLVDVLQQAGVSEEAYISALKDKYSTIMYVCSYMVKSEKAMGEVLKNASKEC